jgi:hypothetical protein
MRLVKYLWGLVGTVIMVHAAHAGVIYNWDFNTQWSVTNADKSGYGTGWGVRGANGLLPNGSPIGTGTMTYADGVDYGRDGSGVAVITNTSPSPATTGVAFNLKLKDPSHPNDNGDSPFTQAFRTAFEQLLNRQYNPYVQVEIWDDGTAVSFGNTTNIPDFGGFGLYTNFVESIAANGVRTNI